MRAGPGGWRDAPGGPHPCCQRPFQRRMPRRMLPSHHSPPWRLTEPCEFWRSSSSASAPPAPAGHPLTSAPAAEHRQGRAQGRPRSGEGRAPNGEHTGLLLLLPGCQTACLPHWVQPALHSNRRQLWGQACSPQAAAGAHMSHSSRARPRCTNSRCRCSSTHAPQLKPPLPLASIWRRNSASRSSCSSACSKEEGCRGRDGRE